MADETTTRTLELLGEIKGGQEHFKETIGEIREHQAKIVDTAQRIENETTRGFGEVRIALARAEERLEAHEREDERRFANHKSEIDRAHRKIGGVTAYPTDGGAAHGTVQKEPMKPAAKAGWITGILTGLGALGAWLADHLKAN